MKNILSLFLMVGLLSTTLHAENIKPAASADQISKVLIDDKSSLAQEFESLNALEAKIKAENLTFSDLDAKTVSSLSLKEDVQGSLVAVAGADDLPLGIPGFWWGFCLGLVGILLVYILMEDSPDRKEETKKALIGALIWVGVWILLWILVLGSAAVL
jgi:hypothetical protein